MSYCRRDLYTLMATASKKKPVVGKIATLMQIIECDRRQDMSKLGQGTVKLITSTDIQAR